MEKIVTHFMRTGVKPEQIGIITPYEGQRAHVLSVMQRSGSLASNLYAEVSRAVALSLCEILLVCPDIATASMPGRTQVSIPGISNAETSDLE